MQPTTKKMKRLERKKKKMVALVNIAEMNNRDRQEVTHCQTMDDTQTTEDNMSTGSLPEESRDNLEGNDVAPESSEGSERKKKKKKKRRDDEDGGQVGEKKKHRRSDGEGTREKEEWPSLPPAHSHKRKSNFEPEIQKDRPLKMVKQYNQVFHNQPEQPSFTDELANWKRDMDRSKKKKEKKKRREIDATVSSEEVEKSEVLSDNNNDNKEETKVLSEEDEIEELRKLLRQRKKQLKEIPMVRLKGIGKEADLDNLDQRTPVLLCDVQNLLLYSQLGRHSPRFPRWVELKKGDRISRTVVMVVEGASAYDLFSQESRCTTLAACDVKVEMVSPYCYNASVVEELCAVPLSSQQKKDLEKRFGKEISPEALLTDKVIKVLRSAFSITPLKPPTSEEAEKRLSLPPQDKFPRTELLLSAWQLIEEGYPLPFHNTPLGNRYPDYVMSKAQYAEVTPSSPLWALDCEMCLTRAGNELTRVSVVNEQHQTVYESFCIPPNPIIDYLTQFSGITPELLKGVTVRLEDIQRDLRNLFPPDVILVGQSLNGDLHALKMMHPYCIDTSVIFNLTGERRRKSKLSRLSQEFLGETIQTAGAAGHDSVEDSLAALKLVQHKLTKSIVFGDAVLSGLKCEDPEAVSPPEHQAREFDDLRIEVGPAMASSLFKHIAMENKSVTVVGQEEKLAEYSMFVAAGARENKQLVTSHTTSSNTETVSAACDVCRTSAFTLAHTVLGDEDNIVLVDSWVKQLLDNAPFNSLLVVLLVGSYDSYANGACLVKVKKPNMRLKHKL